MKEKIETLLAKLKRKDVYRSHRFIPYIVKSLSRMLDAFHAEFIDKSSLRDIAAGLGKAIMDDYTFVESPIGSEVMALCEELLKFTNN